MKPTIADVIAAPGAGAFFFDDQAAIRAGAPHDGFAIVGEPVTPGFEAIRQPAEAVSVMLVLSDGYVAHGDCVAVQYSGVGGREPLLRSAELVPSARGRRGARAAGPDGRFVPRRCRRARCDSASGAPRPTGSPRRCSTRRRTPAAGAWRATIQAEWGLETRSGRVPVYAQCGEQRYENVDKMILREVDSLPHGLINHPSLVGPDGGALVEYVSWVRSRVLELRRRPDYTPVLHFDVYGVIGLVTEALDAHRHRRPGGGGASVPPAHRASARRGRPRRPDRADGGAAPRFA